MGKIGRAWLLAGLLPMLSALGCGTQGVLLEGDGGNVFVAFDELALPGEQIDLRARIQSGDLLGAKPDCVVRFLLDGELYKAAVTDHDGIARAAFVPDKAGLYRFTAELSPNGFADRPPGPQEFVVACRRADRPTMVVDLDKTLVASGFEQVLIGQPEPMPGSPEVMRRLAQDYAVVYLTHRPDYFGPKSKAWLRKNGHPEGPLLLSDIGGFLSGSEKFKTRQIRRLRERFSEIRLGIGDKISDAASYHANGMRAFVILDLPAQPTAEELRALAAALEGVPEDVQAVRDWSQIERAMYEGASFPASAARQELLGQADAIAPPPADRQAGAAPPDRR